MFINLNVTNLSKTFVSLQCINGHFILIVLYQSLHSQIEFPKLFIAPASLNWTL